MLFLDRFLSICLAATLGASLALAQEKPKPQFTVDLKPFGAAPDLFIDQSDSKYEQRGVVNVFWVGDDRVAVAFSTNRRWSGSAGPEPLEARLLVFQAIGAGAGKQLNERNWSISAEGPNGDATLELARGPDNSILAIHQANGESTGAGKIPEGNFVQVLNQDTSLRQDFYISATSAYIPNVLSDSSIALQTFYADKHVSLTWWSGQPLKPGSKLDLPPDKETTIAGPGVAARAVCAEPNFCSGIRIYKPGEGQSDTGQSGKAVWAYVTPSPEFVPVARVFLSPTALLVELRHPDQKPGPLIVVHADGSQIPLPAMPTGLRAVSVTSVASNGQRLAIDAEGETGLCGGLDLWCKQRGEALVIDIPARRIVFEQEISAIGGVADLSPDGRHLAIIDRDKFSLYALP